MASCFQPEVQENGVLYPEVCAVEASDSGWKGKGLILSAEHMRSGQRDLSSVLDSAANVAAAPWNQQQQQPRMFR